MQDRLVPVEAMNRGSSSPSTDSLDILAALRSNFGTYTADVKHISQWLQDAEHNVSQLESRIISLRNEQQELLFRIAQYRSLLSPIRRIPPEILGRIFGFCCERSRIAWDYIDCPVVKLSQVCTGWRELARTTSSLWACIDIDVNHPEQDIDLTVSRVKTHLTMSRQSPLHLSLGVNSDEGVDAELCRPVVECLGKHSERWQTLILDVPRDVLLDPSFSSVRHNLPMLTHLDLWPPDGFHVTPTHTATVEVFSSAPMLRSLKLGSINYSLDPGTTDVEIPWNQLEDLTFTYQYPRNILERLTRASLASTVTIHRCYDHDNSPLTSLSSTT
ncbi:hypothetical protein D9758_011808 [Tetrapyrgos nigripes]|uniref:F-box domain-containing protein n=1 Tax=Tetrapyrgos nigripes TaxID=182062 RepID=A0A8H5CKJ6_9AGAR|nr:hypothetical protein D9758_011808 [Tetrapyrgos nigripes]